MNPNGIQGLLLDVTVVGCTKLKNTEWFSKQDPYLVLEYAGRRYQTRTDTDGGVNPNFNEKFTIELVEGLREISVSVWNSNLLKKDYFIGSGKILLHTVLQQNYHDTNWPLTRASGRRAGEMRVIMHLCNSMQPSPYSYPIAPPSPYPHPPPPPPSTSAPYAPQPPMYPPNPGGRW